MAPPRRSTRAASRASSQHDRPEPSTTARTPGRRPRGNAVEDALPEVPVGINVSYGAAGQLDLGSQLGSRGNDFFSSFIAARDAAVARDEANPPTAEERAAAAARIAARAREESAAPSFASSASGSQALRRSPRKAAARASPALDDLDEESEDFDGINVAVDDDDSDDFSIVEASARGRVHNGLSEVEQVRITRVEADQAHRVQHSTTDFNSTFNYEPPGAVAAPSRTNRFNRRRTPTTPAREHVPVINRLHGLQTAPAQAWRQLRRPFVSLYQRLPHWRQGLVGDTAQAIFDNTPSAIRGAIALAPLLFTLFWLAQYTSIPDYGRYFVEDITKLAKSAGETMGNSTVRRPMFDPQLAARIESLESDLSTVKIDLNHMKKVLPDHLVVQTDPATNALQISPSFWSAVQQKLGSDYALKPGRDNSAANIAWDTFVIANQERINKLVHSSSKDVLGSLVRSDTIVSKDMFLRVVEQQQAATIARIDAQLASMRASSERIAREAATRIATEISQRRPARPRDDPRYLDDAMVRAYVDGALLDRERNFFSQGLGAVVDVTLSSPTYAPEEKSFLANTWARFAPYIFGAAASYSRVARPNPHAVALQHWNDVGDCWCAATSRAPTTGAAQLAVLLGYELRATSLVLEHVANTATLDVASAPQRVEVWGLATADSTAPKHDAGIATECITPVPQAGRGWVCLGSGEYSIHSGNNVQVLPLNAPAASRTLVSKVVVRTTSNWGEERTCLYRVRLLGKDREEVKHEAENGY